jgi:hypothetical protein
MPDLHRGHLANLALLIHWLTHVSWNMCPQLRITLSGGASMRHIEHARSFSGNSRSARSLWGSLPTTSILRLIAPRDGREPKLAGDPSADPNVIHLLVHALPRRIPMPASVPSMTTGIMIETPPSIPPETSPRTRIIPHTQLIRTKTGIPVRRQYTRWSSFIDGVSDGVIW